MTHTTTEILGIDIGGTGIKGALVHWREGTLASEPVRIDTPKPSKPAAIACVVKRIVDQFEWRGPIGCTFPGVVKHGVIHMAANLHKNWIGTDGETLFRDITRSSVHILNDADAAGLAEMAFGAGRGRRDVVLMVTLGTGIGSALFSNARLIPNTELGHIEIRGKDAERRAANSVRERKDLSWKGWGKRVNEYLQRLEALLSPDLIIIGGGVSKKHEKFFKYLKVKAELAPAQNLNAAGIIGAAFAAADALEATARENEDSIPVVLATH